MARAQAGRQISHPVRILPASSVPSRSVHRLPPEMHRCVVLHRNASSELLDVQPTLHQNLRGLEYKRFVVELVRDTDGLSSTAPLYCQFMPSPWQTSNAAKQLWGRRTGTIRLFDENGYLVQDATAATGTPLQGTPSVPAPTPASAPPPLAGGVALERVTEDDVALVAALARFVAESDASDATFGQVSRETVAERVRALARKLTALVHVG